MTNICQSINCPYFSNNYETSWGCQRYNVALLCHLLGKRDKDDYRTELQQSSTQYALHGEGYDIAQLKQENETFLLADPRYIEDKAAKESGFLDSDQAPFRLIDPPKKVKFYKLTGEGWSSPCYYAAYEESKAKEYAYSDNNSSFLLKSEEVHYLDIPDDAVIHKAGLTREDARALVVQREETFLLTPEMIEDLAYKVLAKHLKVSLGELRLAVKYGYAVITQDEIDSLTK